MILLVHVRNYWERVLYYTNACYPAENGTLRGRDTHIHIQYTNLHVFLHFLFLILNGALSFLQVAKAMDKCKNKGIHSLSLNK